MFTMERIPWFFLTRAPKHLIIFDLPCGEFSFYYNIGTLQATTL